MIQDDSDCIAWRYAGGDSTGYKVSALSTSRSQDRHGEQTEGEPTLLQKEKAFAWRDSPEKASECVVRQRLCLRWASSSAYPGSMAASPG